MNLTDEQVLKHITDTFPAELEAKFRAGMAKYSTPLIEKDCLAEAIPEVKDLVVYLTAAKLQKTRAFVVFCLLKRKLWSMEDDELWIELEDLLRPKPLAVAKADQCAKIVAAPKPKFGNVAMMPTNNGTYECVFVGDHWESLENVPAIVCQQIKEGKVFWNHKTSTWQYFK